MDDTPVLTGYEDRTSRADRLGKSVSIEGLYKDYGSFTAVDRVSISIEAGEFVTILGPSGSGKTTTMMAIAGFLDGYSGRIRIGGRPIDHLSAHQRDIGVVFQHLALFPHMTVADNIAFPLRMRRSSKSDIQEKVRSALHRIGLSGFEDRFPAQLSGGQQQRVALARAIVFSPPLLLLDEPFGALDQKLREKLQMELKALHKSLGITVIHVTHDQSEALAISDRIAVMNKGKLEQFSTPHELFTYPSNHFVADFVGDSVFLRGWVLSRDGDTCTLMTDGGTRCLAKSLDTPAPDTSVTMMIRPECVLLGDDAVGCGNEFLATVAGTVFMGGRIRVELLVSKGERMAAIVQTTNRRPMYKVGDRIPVGWHPEDASVLLQR